MSKISHIADAGQSIWLDYIDRHLLRSGELQQMITEDGIRGVTSNPAIFEKAIRTDKEYASALQHLDGGTAAEAFEHIAIADICAAADVLQPLYQQSLRRDGYVSLEVSPKLAHDAVATVKQARRLWQAVNRENLMIKVPATVEGMQAITQLISEGINVNATLLFSRAMYERTAEAFLLGLEKRLHGGADVSGVASVASFFISRIDTAVDTLLETKLAQTSNKEEQTLLHGLLGKVAIANAKLAYVHYKQVFSSARWQALAEHGAQSQRLLWASTGTKNPAYADTLYIEELIGADTVNTAPPATLAAFRKHGEVRASLDEDVEGAMLLLNQLQAAGIALDDTTDQLLDDGVLLFAQAYDKLLAAIQEHGFS